MSEMKRDSGLVALVLLAESVCESGEPAHLHSHGQILSLDVRRADAIRIGVSADYYWYRLHNFTGRIALLAFSR